MQDFPLVSVIILNYNGLTYLGRLLEECLNSVLHTDYPNLEIIFVDNGSTDNSIEFVRRNYKSTINLVENDRNLGFSEGFNTGIRISKGEYIALLSNDMTVDPDWLNPIMRIMESEPKVGIAGFKRFIYGRKDIIDGVGGDLYLCGRAKTVGTLESDEGQYDTINEDLDYVGGAMVLRRVALGEVGLFDPDFFIFFEDVDLCYRVRKKGYKVIYVPDAIIYHRGQATIKGTDPKGLYLEYMGYRSRVRCALIHFTLMRLLSTFLIDFVWVTMANSMSKRLLLKAYWWNLRNIVVTLEKRQCYGPSPPFTCRFPVVPFSYSDLVRRIRETFHM